MAEQTRIKCRSNKTKVRLSRPPRGAEGLKVLLYGEGHQRDNPSHRHPFFKEKDQEQLNRLEALSPLVRASLLSRANVDTEQWILRLKLTKAIAIVSPPQNEPCPLIMTTVVGMALRSNEIAQTNVTISPDLPLHTVIADLQRVLVESLETGLAQCLKGIDSPERVVDVKSMRAYGAVASSLCDCNEAYPFLVPMALGVQVKVDDAPVRVALVRGKGRAVIATRPIARHRVITTYPVHALVVKSSQDGKQKGTFFSPNCGWQDRDKATALISRCTSHVHEPAQGVRVYAEPAHDDVGSCGHLVNDGMNGPVSCHGSNNAEIVCLAGGLCVAVVATRDIDIGHEIQAEYPASFWADLYSGIGQCRADGLAYREMAKFFLNV